MRFPIFYLQKKLQEYCYFYETLESGWFQYRSAVDETKYIGFTKKGRPVRYLINRPQQIRDSQCYSLQQIPKGHIEDFLYALETSKRHHHVEQASPSTEPPQPQYVQHNKLSSLLHSHQQTHNHQHHHHHHNEPSTKPPKRPSVATATTTTENVQTSAKPSATEKNRIFQIKHSIRKQNMTNSRRFKNPDHRRSRILNEEARIKEVDRRHFLDNSNDDNANSDIYTNYTNIKQQQQSDYSNVTKKPSIVSKKVTNTNSGIEPKFRHQAHHGKNHRRKPSI